MSWKIPLADLDYGKEEEDAVLDVLHRRWLTMGGVTQEFEKRFAQYAGAKHAIALSNATVALHLACLAVGLGPGDEVIVPSLTFVATANAVLYTGAQVRFADVHGADDLTIPAAEVEKHITERTRAIVVMHYGGYPCQMDEILSLAAEHGLQVIEDAAHSPGAAYLGQHLGTLGDAGCFSFFSNKNLSTGEGGMLVTDRDDVAEKVKILRSHGMTTLTWDRHKGHAHTYDVVDLGYNYRIDEIRSALGLVQLDKLAAGNARRAAVTNRYWQGLRETSLGLPFSQRFHQLEAAGEQEPTQNTTRSSYHIFPVLLPQGASRERFIDQMKQAGIQTSIHYPPIHLFSYYQKQYPGVSLPLTEDIASREVTLPLYPTLTDAQVDEVISAVRSALEQC